MGSSSCFGLLADGPAAGNREQNTLHGIYTHAHTILIYKILHVSTTFPSTNHRHIKTCIRDCQLQGGRTLVRCFFHKLIEGLFFFAFTAAIKTVVVYAQKQKKKKKSCILFVVLYLTYTPIQTTHTPITSSWPNSIAAVKNISLIHKFEFFNTKKWYITDIYRVGR